MPIYKTMIINYLTILKIKKRTFSDNYVVQFRNNKLFCKPNTTALKLDKKISQHKNWLIF
ncbi:MAG: hypothetical protein EAZ97_03610 [Bacteroidetes bacterium]|nr:MAG: hypothetical protein EAZ97_03610 [Bacteroidota bacterium]